MHDVWLRDRGVGRFNGITMHYEKATNKPGFDLLCEK